ncbi:hypothetical protein A1O1_03280 [Capronia coronata CBS 617.96]|uniref:Allantoin permease n=1 Tax=Capronia coronata CBS 617.96 TaxID=1182541 RepID=W9Z013_9EURO|nr:uncharacterized protein A1O1_03280 [Capronia coronata CBS 617.96]EXJ94881.1 hypothetical protein A1O1_03280 [Capronia coronata CBS 617.96]
MEASDKPTITGINAFRPKNLIALLRLKKSNFKTGIQSKENFKQYLRTPGSDADPTGSYSWINDDLLPSAPESRTWVWWNYFFFYFSLSMDNWTLGSTMIGTGMNWWQSILIVFFSQIVSSVAMAINSRSGEVYHVGYPIISRAVFGTWGAYYVVFARAVLAIVYYAIKLYIGSSFLVNMLNAVFGDSFRNLHNSIPASVGMTSAQFIAFFLYWLIHIPFTLLRPYQLRWLFTVKMCTVVPACFGLFIFCMANTKGNIGGGLPGAPASKSTSFAWFVVYAFNSGLGNTANLITNQPDFSRWAKYKYASVWSQLIANPISVTINASLGILATSAINHSWGLQLWNPWDLLDAILLRYPTSSVRFAVFLCATFWALLVLGTNVAANMIPFGSDSTMLLPRYINMTRGQFLGLCLAWAVNPWQILRSAEVFLNFLGGYVIFMAAAVGIMVADYYVLTKGNIFLRHLYDGNKANPHYYYHKGWNVQAYIAYVVAVAIPFPGFCGSLGANVSETAMNLGHLGWCLSFVVSIVVYIAICYVWPTRNQKVIKSMNLKFEEMAGVELDPATIPNYHGAVIQGREVPSLDESESATEKTVGHSTVVATKVA